MSSVTSGIEIEMDESKWPMNRSFCVYSHITSFTNELSHSGHCSFTPLYSCNS